MKHTHIPFVLFLIAISSINAFSQSEDALLGKWKMVKWIYKGTEMDVAATYKTDEVYEIFLPENKFRSVIGEKVLDGTYTYNTESSELLITAGPVKVQYTLEQVDEQKRIVSSPMIGTLEYVKVVD